MSTTVETPYETAVALIEKLTRTEITVPVQCELVGRTAVRVSLGPEVVRADEPRVLGGGGTAPTPSQYALAALGSCTAITFGYFSYKLGIPIDLLRVNVQGDIDLRGFVGLGDGVRPGFGEARVRVTVSGPGSVERYEELRRAVDRHSPGPRSVRQSGAGEEHDRRGLSRSEGEAKVRIDNLEAVDSDQLSYHSYSESRARRANSRLPRGVGGR